MSLLGVPVGWLMIGAAGLLVALAIHLVAKHDLDRIEGAHFAATTNDENRLAALAVVACLIAAAVLYHFGRTM